MSLRVLSGLAGVHAGALFGTAPPHVDPAKRPGASSLAPLVGLPGTVRDTLTLRTLVWSPNLVWLAVAAATYAALPYDMQAAARGFSWTWVAPRVAINASVAFAYYFYFYYGLFVAKWAKRKFAPGSYPTAENMLHNAVHWTGGVLMASLLECVMVRLWATGKVPHVPDSELASSPAEALKLLAWVAVVPVWRELHFYAAHRFVHIRALYTFVHSLHHRITDPEPFSGLTMHPVEHLYYFANAFIPTLYLRSSPFLYTWISVHAVLAPACGHSGWEDHFQSDLYHWLHHANFECNYGSLGSAFFDRWLGTFREKIGRSEHYAGVDTQSLAQPKGETQRRVWSATARLGPPKTFAHGCYDVVTAILYGLAIAVAVAPVDAERAQIAAGAVAFGPVVAALALSRWSKDRMPWRWPFHKERVAFGITVVAGLAFSALPIFDAMRLVATA